MDHSNFAHFIFGWADNRFYVEQISEKTSGSCYSTAGNEIFQLVYEDILFTFCNTFSGKLDDLLGGVDKF